MLSNEEKINLLKIEGKRLIQAYESVDIKENMFMDCPVCAEAERLRMKLNVKVDVRYANNWVLRNDVGDFYVYQMPLLDLLVCLIHSIRALKR